MFALARERGMQPELSHPNLCQHCAHNINNDEGLAARGFDSAYDLGQRSGEVGHSLWGY
jgi:hypothetical protein